MTVANKNTSTSEPMTVIQCGVLTMLTEVYIISVMGMNTHLYLGVGGWGKNMAVDEGSGPTHKHTI